MLLRSASVNFLFIACTIALPSKSTEKACRDISAALPGKVSIRGSIPYLSEVHSYWSTALRDVKPACVAFPQSSEDVASAVKALNKYPDVEFAVKSGGHTPNHRHSSVQDGVLMSTKDLSGVTYDHEKQVAYVKPGGEWNDIIGPLDEHGVTLVGGRLGEWLALTLLWSIPILTIMSI